MALDEAAAKQDLFETPQFTARDLAVDTCLTNFSVPTEEVLGNKEVLLVTARELSKVRDQLYQEEFLPELNLLHFVDPDADESLAWDKSFPVRVGNIVYLNIEALDSHIALLSDAAATEEVGLKHVGETVESVVMQVIQAMKARGNWSPGYDKILDKVYGDNRAAFFKNS